MQSKRAKTRFLLMLWIAASGPIALVPVRAEEVDPIKAIKVKAAYLYNFARFVHWPEKAFGNDQKFFVIGVLGDDRFARVLTNTVKSKTVVGRAVSVRQLRWYEGGMPTGLTGCHVLYVCHSERARLGDIIAALHGRPVLVVADIDEFAKAGGMIGLVLENGRIVFEINREAMKRAGLRASSKLLKLARIVEARKPYVPRQRADQGGR